MTSHRGRMMRGFTLIEILVAVSVIVILMGLVITVGSQVVGGQKSSQTTGVLRTLDRALEEFFTDAETFPKFDIDIYRRIQGNRSSDIRSYEDGGEYPARPAAAVFIEQVRGFGAIDAIIQGLPDQFVRSTTRPGPPDGATDPDGAYVVVSDAWGKEILYVHPQNELAEAFYGTCTNQRPYFISPGQDQGFGFEVEMPQGAMTPAEHQARVLKLLDDNVTSTPVGAPRRDQAFFDEYRRES